MKKINELHDLIGEIFTVSKYIEDYDNYENSEHYYYPAKVIGYSLNTYYFHDKQEPIYLEIDTEPIEGYDYSDLLKALKVDNFEDIDVFHYCFSDLSLADLTKYITDETNGTNGTDSVL